MGFFKKLFGDAADELKKNLEDAKKEMLSNLEEVKQDVMGGFTNSTSNSRDNDEEDDEEPKILHIISVFVKSLFQPLWRD